MNRLLTCLLVTASLLISSLSAQGRRGRNSPPPDLEHLDFIDETFASVALGKDAEYGVFLPKDYGSEENADRSYPLVIWLHGMNENHRRFYTRGGGQMLDDLTGKAEIPEMIFVCANGDRSSFYINGNRPNSAYEDLICEDLLGHIEGTYRVSAERSKRAITGVSMGGYGALKIALKNPDAFGAVATHSAAVLPRTVEELERDFPWVQGRGRGLLTSVFGDPLDEDLWRRENLMLLVDGLEEEDLDGLRICFGASDRDRYRFDISNEELHELLEEKGIKHNWTLTEGGGHSWGSGYMQMALPNTLRFLGEGFAPGEKPGERASAEPANGKGKLPN
ncbi:MAG: alpha/beta hydrolase [Planctomycetota bacterium]|jgi:S-formylglutathione hydrolase FrmB